MTLFTSFLLFFLSKSVSSTEIYNTFIDLIIDGCFIGLTCNGSPPSILFISHLLCSLGDIILRLSILFGNLSPMHTLRMYSLLVSICLLINCQGILKLHSNLLLSICYLLISSHYRILDLIGNLRAYF